VLYKVLISLHYQQIKNITTHQQTGWSHSNFSRCLVCSQSSRRFENVYVEERGHLAS